jgi:alpha-D-xyloside xylohydrolase
LRGIIREGDAALSGLLVVDYPEDKNTFNISDEYMIGDNVLAAPLADSVSTRKVYLPEGNWYDFNTNKVYTGGQSYNISTALDQIPIFIKEGTILPMAKPVQFISPDTIFDITCYVYGQGATTTTLFEDDGTTFNYENTSFNIISLDWRNSKGKIDRKGNYKAKLYNIKSWIKI